MKKLFGLGFALLCLTACSDDDSSSPSINLDNLPKKWYNVSYKIAGKTVAYDGHEPCGKDYTEFIGTGTVKEVDYKLNAIAGLKETDTKTNQDF